MLKGIFETINVSRIDHDAKAKQGNKPDFIVHKFDVPLLYIEVKDIEFLWIKLRSRNKLQDILDMKI